MMNNPGAQGQPMTVQQFTDALIRVAIVALLVIASLRVFSPFMDLMLWALILAVTIYPSHQKLVARVGGKQGRAASMIVLLGIMILGVPVALLGASIAEQLGSAYESYQAGTLSLRAPDESVAGWPVIGQRVYEGWSAASENLPEYIEANKAAIESVASKALAAAKGVAGNVFLFIGALIVAGIMMAYGQAGSQAMHHILCRIAGTEQGPQVHSLATMTTRSVAAGVLGVALIQAILFGVGMMLAGVPAPGLLAMLVLLLAIMQLPALLVSIPVIIWVWRGGDMGTAMAVVWTVYFLLAGAADNVLKPMLLGRGVDAPMPVILIGALGGMISTGFIGLFTGAVILAVGYQIFMQWVAMRSAEGAAAHTAQTDEVSEATE
jgi:predicted PurR-regulated permease PerM